MENFQNFNNFSFKSLNNEKIIKDEFENEIIENKLALRKKKLYQILLQKRKNYFIPNSLNDNACQLKEVSILIHKNTFEEIQSGLNKFYDFLINNEKLEKTDIKYIYENIYYRLLDLITSEKIFEKNANMNKIFFLINYLTTENNIFIEPITETIFLSQFKEVIEINLKNSLFLSKIIPVLSDMMINKKKFAQIMKEIDIIKIIKILMTEKGNKESIEQLLILMNNFIININENKTSKYQFILDYALSLFNENLINYFNDENESLIILSLFDILIYTTNDPGNLQKIKESNCIQFIKYLIDNHYKHNLNINNNKYILKSVELLSNILLITNNLEDKKNIILYIYSNSNSLIDINLPFVKEFNDSITNKNFPFVNVLLKCIISLVNNCAQFCELYCNNDFISCLMKLIMENVQKKIKNQIIIFFINLVECDNIKIYKNILNSNIIPTIISYLNKKKKSKKESTKIIIFNILLFIKNCFLIEEKNNINEIKNILDKYKYKEIIEYLIDDKDKSISDISRITFIKYFSESENIYTQKKNNNKKEEKEYFRNMMEKSTW